VKNRDPEVNKTRSENGNFVDGPVPENPKDTFQMEAYIRLEEKG